MWGQDCIFTVGGAVLWWSLIHLLSLRFIYRETSVYTIPSCLKPQIETVYPAVVYGDVHTGHVRAF